MKVSVIALLLLSFLGLSMASAKNFTSPPALKWNRTFPYILGPTVCSGSSMFIADIKGFLYEVQVASGNVLWTRSPNGPFNQSGTPVIWNSSLLVIPPSGDHNIIALDLVSKQFIWQFTAPTNDAFMSTYRLHVWQDRIVFAGDYPYIYSVNAATGALVWQSSPLCSDSTECAVLADSLAISPSGEVCVGTGVLGWPGYIQCFDGQSGAQTWQYSTWDGVQTAPLFAGNWMLIHTNIPQNDPNPDIVYAFSNPPDGTSDYKWFYQCGSILGVVASLPSLIYANGLIYGICRFDDQIGDATVYALDYATHKVVWRWRDTYLNPYASLLVTNTTVFVSQYGTYIEAMIALDAHTGKQQWSFPIPGDRIGDGGPIMSQDNTLVFSLLAEGGPFQLMALST